MYGLERRAMHVVRHTILCVEHCQGKGERSWQLAAGRPDVLELQLLRPQLHQLVRSQLGIGLGTMRSTLLWRDRNTGLMLHLLLLTVSSRPEPAN